MKQQQRHGFPPLGQRIVKTAIAVLVCLLFYYLRGRWGDTMPAEAMITAIICLQPNLENTKSFALNRLIGTLIGGFWGLVFLLIASLTGIASVPILTLAVMAAGLLPTLYTTILLKRPG
ncbi:MAG: FUSC family protein, partial [Clostridia bacterium]|nr:FUSC family protein [Clostridia bacterium]